MKAGRSIGRSGPWRLALRRCWTFWSASANAWRLTLDWTVLLYLVLPGLWIVGGIYTDWLRHPPDWLARLPERTSAAALAALMLRARLRTFADPGDALFLRASRRWVAALTRAGLAYTLAARLAVAAAAGGLLLPLLPAEPAWRLADGAVFVLAAALMGFVWTLLRDRAERRWRGWRRAAAVYGGRVALFAAWLPAASIFKDGAASALAVYSVVAALAAAAVLLGLQRMRMQGMFEQELGAERRAYADNVGWVLTDTPKAPRPPASRRPVLLRRPGPLLRKRDPASRIAELWLRSMARDGDMMKNLIYYTLLGVAAVWLSPPWLAALAWFGMGALLLWWLNGQWELWVGERYMSLFEWGEETKRMAGSVGRQLLLRPAALLWSAAIGLHAGWLYGGLWWLAAVVLPAVCYPLLGRMSGAISALSMRRAARREPREQGRRIT